MKLVKARGEYECHECGDEINRGDMYCRKSFRLGSSKRDTFEDGNIVVHGFTIDVKHCERCKDIKATPKNNGEV